MKSVIRIALAVVGLTTVPAAAAILGSASFASPHVSSVPKGKPINVSFREKTQARIVPAAGDGSTWNWTSALIEGGQAMGPLGADPGFGGPEGLFGDGPPLSFPPPQRPAVRGPFGFAHPPGPPPPPRIACEEDVDRLMALTGYLKSKMRLQGDQKVAWQKVEQPASPAIEKMRDLCARLPSQPAESPGFLELIDFAEKQMTARVELLRTIGEPLHALYEVLSPDQRALLAIHPPGHHPGPPPPGGDRL